jgi:MoaA/NifB/PqqE/SkfB family radical SAM enzyme
MDETSFFFNVDIEPTNRCNAHCYFCPRDATPHQGLMTTEVFDQALARVVEFEDLARTRFGAPVKVNLCGLGEPLLNRHSPEFVRKIRDAGFECSISSNGALLDEQRGRALLDAGLQAIEINVGEEGEDYEEIYKLPFERTCDNVVRFTQMAGEQCKVRVVLVDHRRDPAHMDKMKRFWKERGVKHFLPLDVMNRAGALFVDDMQYDSFSERFQADALLREKGVEPVCPAPFGLLFIGYDGQYYLCCADWRKEVPLGSVFDTSFQAIAGQKLEHVISRAPICKNCNHDPVNRLTEELRARSTGEVDDAAIEALVDRLTDDDRTARDIAEKLDAVGAGTNGEVPRRRRLIPVTAE